MFHPAQNSDSNQALHICYTEGRNYIFIIILTQNGQAQDGRPVREAGSAFWFPVGLVWKQRGGALLVGHQSLHSGHLTQTWHGHGVAGGSRGW